jgi:hypothetical protein
MKAEVSILFAVAYSLVVGEKSLAAGGHIRDCPFNCIKALCQLIVQRIDLCMALFPDSNEQRVE